MSLFAPAVHAGCNGAGPRAPSHTPTDQAQPTPHAPLVLCSQIMLDFLREYKHQTTPHAPRVLCSQMMLDFLREYKHNGEKLLIR